MKIDRIRKRYYYPLFVRLGIMKQARTKRGLYIKGVSSLLAKEYVGGVPYK